MSAAQRLLIFFLSFLLVNLVMIAIAGLYGLLHLLISEEYFRLLSGNRHVFIPVFPLFSAMGDAAIMGIPAGLILGLWMAYKRRFPLSYLLKGLFSGMLVHGCCWLLGGLIGGAWAWMDTGSYLTRYPQFHWAENYFAVGFVGGAIYGSYAGVLPGVAGTIYAIVKYNKQWKASALSSIIDGDESII